MATDRIKLLANKTLPYLVLCAQQQKTVTYRELGELLHVNLHVGLSPILIYIRDHICDSLGYPLITAIVISEIINRPQNGFFPDGVAHLTEAEIWQKYERYRDVVFSFSRWNELLDKLDIKPLSAKVQVMD
jgi:hypothetical protein